MAPDTSARFAAGILQRRPTWEYIWKLFIALKPEVKNVRFAVGNSARNSASTGTRRTFMAVRCTVCSVTYVTRSSNSKVVLSCHYSTIYQAIVYVYAWTYLLFLPTPKQVHFCFRFNPFPVTLRPWYIHCSRISWTSATFVELGFLLPGP